MPNTYTDEEKKLLDVGFLNAIGAIYLKLDDSQKVDFKNMVVNTVGETNFNDSVAEVVNTNSCPKDCTYVRGAGCVC